MLPLFVRAAYMLKPEGRCAPLHKHHTAKQHEQKAAAGLHLIHGGRKLSSLFQLFQQVQGRFKVLI